jgi:ABC-type dipeptide/oligopeptide/nickel transport system permease component
MGFVFRRLGAMVATLLVTSFLVFSSLYVAPGDLGRSFQFREDVGSLVTARLGTTLGLVAMSAVLITVVGLAAGIIGSLNAGRT